MEAKEWAKPITIAAFTWPLLGIGLPDFHSRLPVISVFPTIYSLFSLTILVSFQSFFCFEMVQGVAGSFIDGESWKCPWLILILQVCHWFCNDENKRWMDVEWRFGKYLCRTGGFTNGNEWCDLSFLSHGVFGWMRLHTWRTKRDRSIYHDISWNEFELSIKVALCHTCDSYDWYILNGELTLKIKKQKDIVCTAVFTLAVALPKLNYLVFPTKPFRTYLRVRQYYTHHMMQYYRMVWYRICHVRDILKVCNITLLQ